MDSINICQMSPLRIWVFDNHLKFHIYTNTAVKKNKTTNCTLPITRKSFKQYNILKPQKFSGDICYSYTTVRVAMIS